ncbi:hypothetical protein RJ640_028236 [Escallonia rubra]|uniref:Uncharacterized protein n=1 Tax=Escallonia rubra TaxID=112253 RepID=A0AA88S9V7_9ASTE|nr:hypothetical protein RJ640_028236 [Escallonia rubra]
MAVVTLVVQLESQHLAQIAKGVQRLTGSKNVRIKTVIGPSLVAGFTIRYGNSGSKLIDMSVKKQFEEIAAQPDIGDTSEMSCCNAIDIQGHGTGTDTPAVLLPSLEGKPIGSSLGPPACSRIKAGSSGFDRFSSLYDPNGQPNRCSGRFPVESANSLLTSQ